MRISFFLIVCWLSISSATKRNREEIRSVAFNRNVDQQLIPNRVIGVLNTVPNNFINEADYLLHILRKHKVFSAPVYSLEIHKKFPESTVSLMNVTAWLAEIRDPVFVIPRWFHSLITKHEHDTTDEILRLVLARHSIKPTDPDFWERRIEIWRRYCVESCLSDGNITQEAWQEYLMEYRKKISRRNWEYSKSVSFQTDLPQQYLLEADYIVAMFMQNYPFSLQSYLEQLQAWIPATTITAEDVAAITKIILRFTLVPRWFHELLMANKALNSDDLADNIVALEHPEFTDASSVSRQINIWRHYCISSPIANCQESGEIWKLSGPGTRLYFIAYRQKIAQMLARNLGHEAEKKLLRKHISELPRTPPAEELLAFIRSKMPNSHIGTSNVKNLVHHIENQLFVPKWFHELLLEHPDKSADEIAAIIADSNTSWTNRSPRSVKASVQTWRQYVISHHGENKSFVHSESQSELRDEPIYRLTSETTKRLLQN